MPETVTLDELTACLDPEDWGEPDILTLSFSDTLQALHHLAPRGVMNITTAMRRRQVIYLLQNRPRSLFNLQNLFGAH